MNRKTATLILPLGILGLSACTPAQVGRMLTTHRRPTPAVVETVPTVAAVTLPGLSVTVAIPCGNTGGIDCPQPKIPCGNTGGLDCRQPPTPPTTVYGGPQLMQCDDGSFAPQGQCPPPATQPPPP